MNARIFRMSRALVALAALVCTFGASPAAVVAGGPYLAAGFAGAL